MKFKSVKTTWKRRISTKCFHGNWFHNAKLKRLKYVCADLEINLNEVAYIGDDVNDLEVLAAVGLSAMAGNSTLLAPVCLGF